MIAFPDLGMEAIREFEVENMPVTVAVDSEGNSIHETGPAEWRSRIMRLNADLAWSGSWLMAHGALSPRP